MNFAPVFIPTLCRFEHFKRCILSLASNKYADQTIVYIALDYPAKESHREGYELIKKFLETESFPFKELRVIKRSVNYGALKNYQASEEEIFELFDRLILSEDDDVFSPNFLEYINKNLDAFEHDKDVIAVCGFCWPLHFQFGRHNEMLQSFAFSAWGYGIWKDRYQILKSEISREKMFKHIGTFKRAFYVWRKSEKYFSLLVSSFFSGFYGVYDASISLYVYLNEKFILIPKFSKVLNNGFDGSGCGCSYEHPSFKNQKLDRCLNFWEIDAFKCDKKNSELFQKIDEIPYSQIKFVKLKRMKLFFKSWVKYFSLRIFPLSLVLKISDSTKHYK